MIPDLDVNEETEARVWEDFERWSKPFHKRLQSSGLSGLLERYDTLVTSIETQSCRHTRDGSLKTGEAWQYCCGIYYEYTNNVACRHAFERIFQIAPDGVPAQILERVAELDRRLRSQIDPPLEELWWYTLPRSVLRSAGRGSETE
jgi:hypothetical protein